jgi:peptidoglycan/LPS O-acetylase OafA/YrhL
MYDKVPKFIAYSLEKFGIATYGVYLLHPIVLLYLKPILKRIHFEDVALNDLPIAKFICTFIITIICAILSYNVFENKFIQIGKKLTQAWDKRLEKVII